MAETDTRRPFRAAVPGGALRTTGTSHRDFDQHRWRGDALDAYEYPAHGN